MRGSGSLPLLRLGLSGLLLVMAPVLAPAADLVEPWDRGFSNMELYFSTGEEEESAAAALLGMGLPAGFSLGATLSRGEDGSASWGVVSMYSRRFRDIEIDLCAEVAAQQASREAETQGDWLLGTEWSFHRHRWVPYLRATVISDRESGGFHGLAGLMMPSGERLELHLELSSEAPVEGAWPVHLAVGPNVSLPGGVEILPEISLLHDRATGGIDWLFTVGLVLNPQSLRRTGLQTR